MTKARILLVEDEPLIRDLLSETLLEADFELIEAGTGEEAMKTLERQESFDLLLTDVHMPGQTNGVDLARFARIRQPDLLVVFATGRPETLEAFGKMGPREVCLSKPFSPSEALKVVERLLAGFIQPQGLPPGG